ncbi:MAG: alpha/beta fold hydrolase [Nitriliruptorales bacterium]|nr:alpha/beta fold hydrolase [Nitriliruptorales bacterium]
MYTETEGPEGAVDLVLLHGGIGAGRYHWSKLLPALSTRYRVHLPDLPGHGRTPLPPDGRYDRALHVEAVEELLDRLAPPVHVAGFSMGGHASMALAAKRPEAFASLTLIGVSYRDHPGLRSWRDKFDPDRLAEAYPLWVRALSRLHAPLGGPDAWREVCRRDAGGLEIEVDPEDLGALDCPVLLMRGDRDEAVDPAQHADLRAIWGQADECVVPAGGHEVQLTRRVVVEPVLLDFLSRAGADPTRAHPPPSAAGTD